MTFHKMMKRTKPEIPITATPTALAQVESYPTDRYVVAGDDFRAAGAMRLSDIFWFLDDWSTATVGQFRHDVSVRGLSPFAQQTWALFVDGMRHDLAQLGTINLNRLPVPITQIDSIVVLSVPQVHQGEWIDGGALHIYTRRAARGINVGGHLVFGNETGETGPFFYTPLRTTNLERLGPDFSLHAGYAARQLSVDAGVFSLRHWLSDNKIVTRHQSARMKPLLVLIAPWARVEARLGGSSLTVFAGRSSVTDYLYLAEVGREIPADNAFTTLGVAGRVPALVGAWGITYRLGHQVNALTPVENTLGVALGWKTQRSEGQVLAVHTTGSATTTVGGSIRHVTAVAGRDLSNASYTVSQVSFERTSRAGGTINHRIGAAISNAGSGIGINASGSLTMAVGRNHRIRLALSASKQLSENDSRLWFWIPRGFTLLDDAGVPATSVYPALTLLIFNNAADTFSELTDAVSADSNMIEFAVPLSELGNDDGNMDVAGYSAHQSFEGFGQTLDYIPNTGHGTVGD